MPEGEPRPEGKEEREEDYVFFGPVAREQLDMQCQYASHYVGGRSYDGSPDLAQGLRFLGRPQDYHELKIHKDDVAEFVRRVQEYREKRARGE